MKTKAIRDLSRILDEIANKQEQRESNANGGTFFHKEMTRIADEKLVELWLKAYDYLLMLPPSTNPQKLSHVRH